MTKSGREAFKKLLLCAYCFAAAFAVLLVCSRSSPAYVFNFWDDANCYFTIGKSIFNGRVPYRDLFDQKGILLYFIYGLGYCISHYTFAGVFIMELIAGFCVTLGLYRILMLYTKDCWLPAAVFVPVVYAHICSARSFYWGGSAEEFVLPFLVWALYLMLRFYRASDAAVMPRRYILICGTLAGCVLNIKFTSLGFFIAWILVVMAIELRAALPDRANTLFTVIKRIAADGFLYLAGMALATLPFLLYFLINHAVRDWFHVYIYLNVFVYSEKLSLLVRLTRMSRLIYNHIFTDMEIFLPAIFAVIYGFIRALISVDKSRRRSFAAVLFLSAGLLFFIFIGGVDLPYYPLPAAVFTVLGYAAACELAIGILSHTSHILRMRSWSEMLVLCAALFYGLFFSFKNSMNVEDMSITADGLWLYEFRDQIELSGVENPSLINIYSFDNGLYTVTGIVPDCYYPQTQTIHLDDVWETQKKYIKDEKADFIISRDSEMDFALDKYELINRRDFTVGGAQHTYYLYERVRSS